MAEEFTLEQRRELFRIVQALRAATRATVVLGAPLDDLRALADRAEALAGDLASHAPPPAARPFPAYSSNPIDLPFSPVSGAFNPVAPELRLSVVGDSPRHVVGVLRFSSVYEGPPRHVHGGWIAALFDQVLASANRANGVAGMTAALTLRYVRPTPLDTEIRFDGWTERTEDRKVFARGECRSGGELLAECQGLFVRLDAESARQLFG
jgi:acyl-coenzyme A thioesterase PaaI-like protein